MSAAETALKLYQDEGEPIPAIAKRLNITVPAVYNALRRAGVRIGTRRFSQAGSEGRHGSYAVIPDPVDRDPCTYCGIRADVGCKHNRRAA